MTADENNVIQFPDPRPKIDVKGKEIFAMEKEAMASLVRANEPPVVFARGDVMVRVVNGGNGPVVYEYTRESLKAYLSSTARWVQILEPTEKRPEAIEKLVKPDPDVVASLLDWKAYPDLPQLDRIVSAPVFGPDGKLITKPGYHASSKTLYIPDPAMGSVVVPDPVTADDLKAAKALLRELFGTKTKIGFPFSSSADRANALAMALSPFLRELIPGTTPMFLVEAPMVGTGKGLLVRALMYLSAGEVPFTPDPGSDIEWGKVITALLTKSPPLMMFDNVTGVLGGANLAAAITTPVWDSRLLGFSRTIHVKIRNIWIATSNNAKLTRDMPRRCVLIRIDAQTELPSERTGFSHPNLMEWVADNRAELVGAALTVCQFWVQAGMPNGHVKPLGSFEEWTRVLGGVLETAGIGGFLKAWHEMPGGDKPMTVAELRDRVGQVTELLKALPESLPDLWDRDFAQKLGYLLKRNRGGVYGGYRLDSAGTLGGRAKWIVIPLAEK